MAVYEYRTTQQGLRYYNFLGDPDLMSDTQRRRAEQRRAQMTAGDWAGEQLLVLARDSPETEASLLSYLTHSRDSILDGSFPVPNRVIAMENVKAWNYAIANLPSMLRKLQDRGFLSKTRIQ